MFLQEALAQHEAFGAHKHDVKVIRGNMQKISAADLARILLVSPANCQSVIDTIFAHPDWDDERVTEEIYWDD